jgi:hypothetical protein
VYLVNYGNETRQTGSHEHPLDGANPAVAAGGASPDRLPTCRHRSESSGRGDGGGQIERVAGRPGNVPFLTDCLAVRAGRGAMMMKLSWCPDLTAESNVRRLGILFDVGKVPFRKLE